MLPRIHRLPSSEISLVMRSGKRIVGATIQLIVQNNEVDVSRFVPQSGTPLGTSRFAIIISTRIDKRATRRNRMRRLISESIRHLIPRLTTSIDCIVIVRKDFNTLTEPEVEKIVANALRL